MFDIDRAIKLAKMHKDISEQAEEMFQEANGFINIAESSRIHVTRDAFLELFHGEYDRRERANIGGVDYWYFYADADGATFFCLYNKEDLNAE